MVFPGINTISAPHRLVTYTVQANELLVLPSPQLVEVGSENAEQRTVKVSALLTLATLSDVDTGDGPKRMVTLQLHGHDDVIVAPTDSVTVHVPSWDGQV